MSKLLIILPAFFIFFINNSYAQVTWKISFNKAMILEGKSGEENVVGFFKRRKFNNSDSFTIQYNGAGNSKLWNRTIYLNAGKTENIKTIMLAQQSGSASVNAHVVEDAMEKQQPLFIYTMSLPKDPSKAAAVRVRRILLCRIEWN